jgi:hypothetical protein
MNKLVQGLLYGAFAICVGFFSVAPTYRYADPDIAMIKLSLSHAANRVEACIKLTPQQINDRATRGLALNECARERLPVTVELEIDGARVLLVTAAPSGIWNDGPSSVYERLGIAPGTHTITARLRDTAREHGWDYEHSESVTLSPGRYFTISFRAETGGFGFR